MFPRSHGPPTVLRVAAGRAGWAHARAAQPGRRREPPPRGHPAADPDHRRARRRGVRRAERAARLDPRPRRSPTWRSTPRAWPARSAGSSRASAVPMYASQEARDAGHRPTSPAQRPSDDPDPAPRRRRPTWPTRSTRCPDDQWSTPRSSGRRAAGPSPPATCPAMRLREVEIHHADLAAGYTAPTGRPAFVTLLLDTLAGKRVSATLLRRPGDRPRPHLDLRRRWTDRQRHRPRTSAGGSPAAATATD